jgi:hypothetical protein
MMATREGLIDKNRVGLRAVNKSDRIRAGSHLLKKYDAPSMATTKATSPRWPRHQC